MGIRRNSRRLAFMFTLLLALLSSLSVYSAAENNKPLLKVAYFYENPCNACDEAQKFLDLLNREVGAEKENIEVDIGLYNTFKESGEGKLREYCKKYGIKEQELRLPLLFINDSHISGKAEVEARLKELFLEEKGKLQAVSQNSGSAGGPEDSRIAYFHINSCSECSSVKNFFNSLADAYVVDAKGKEFTSRLEIMRYDIDGQEELKRIKEYFRVYNVPEKDQKVPIVFLRETYLAGEEAIKGKLVDSIKGGHGIGMTWELGKETMGLQKQFSPYGFFGILLTGLANGLNPCSISMLLFFISIIAVKNVSVVKLGFSYAAGKLIAYFLLGTVLFNLILRLNGEWFQAFQGVLKIALVGIALLLMGVSLLDGIAAQNERYNRIRLQLPSVLRKLNHQWISRVSRMDGEMMQVSAAFILGMVISAGEFLCTGQIFLMTLIYMLKSNPVFDTHTAACFLVYGVMLVIPLLVLTFLVQKGRELFDVSESVRRFMPVIKLINAVVFLGFGILVAVKF